jgi:hypothetical protein
LTRLNAHRLTTNISAIPGFPQGEKIGKSLHYPADKVVAWLTHNDILKAIRQVEKDRRDKPRIAKNAANPLNPIADLRKQFITGKFLTQEQENQLKIKKINARLFGPIERNRVTVVSDWMVDER